MPRPPKWEEDLNNWEAALYSEGLSPNTVEVYLKTARYAFRYAKEHDWPLNPRLLAPSHVYQYYDSIQGLKSKTQMAYMVGFLGLLKFVKTKDVKDMKFRIHPERGEVPRLEREQVLRLLECWPNTKILAARVLWTYTGIREFETRKLRKRALTENWLSVEAGKGRKARKIPIDEEFWQMLEPYLEWRDVYERKWGATDYFLAHPANPLRQTGPLRPYSPHALSQMSQIHGATIGIPHASSHPFRRQFGTDLYDNGCPPTEIQGYYGHTTLEETMRYIGKREQISAESMRKYRSSYRRETKRD